MLLTVCRPSGPRRLTVSTSDIILNTAQGCLSYDYALV
jgi:hypothetical protein